MNITVTRSITSILACCLFCAVAPWFAPACADDPVLPIAVAVDSFQPGCSARQMFDGEPKTHWHTVYELSDNKLPHWIICDLTKSLPIASVMYQGRHDLNNGLVNEFAVFVSDDCQNWGQPILESKLERLATEQIVKLPDGTKGRYLKFEIRSNHQKNAYGSCGEFRINVPGYQASPVVCLDWNPSDANSQNLVAQAQDQANAALKNGKFPATVLFPQTTPDQADFEAWRAMDGDPNTQYRVNWQDRYHGHRVHPAHFALDLGQRLLLTGFTYQGPKTGARGEIKSWKFRIGEKPEQIYQVVCAGQFAPRDEKGAVVNVPDPANPGQNLKDSIYFNTATITVDPSGKRTVLFKTPVITQYVWLETLESQYQHPWTTIAELELLGLDNVSLVKLNPYDATKQAELEQLKRNGFRAPCDRWDCKLDLAIRTLEFVEKVKPIPELGKRLLDLERSAATTKAEDLPALGDKIAALRREIIFQRPELDFQKILISKREPTKYCHMCDQYLGRHSGPGDGLVILENWKQPLNILPKSGEPAQPIDPRNPAPMPMAYSFDAVKATPILAGKLPAGSVLNPDLHWNADRVVFSFCDHEKINAPNDPNLNNSLRSYYLWEAALDGSWVRQLTGTDRDKLETWENRKTVIIEDFDPCYLPDGGIAFVSTRTQTFGRCHGGRYTPTYMVYRCDKDGNQIEQLSWGEANEWAPAVLANGRLIYTRWDYINRHDTIFQSLWQMLPDGTGTAHYYGNYSPSPNMTIDALQVPNSRQTVTLAMAHHSYSAGSIILVDPTRGEDGYEPLTRITPETAFRESHDPIGGGAACGYSSPFPLSEDLFLAADIQKNWAGQGGRDPINAWGIMLVDSLGGREPLYRDPNISCFDPIPVIKRTMPPELPSALPERSAGFGHRSEYFPPTKDVPTGVFYVQNVYDCRQELEAGCAKKLRINKIFGQNRNGKGWQSTAENEIMKNVLGTVPINADGSVAFRAPAGVPLQLQLLDDNDMAVMTMRSFVYLQEGENNGCVGCHEQRNSTLSGYTQSRAVGKINEIQPVSGTVYPGGFSFQKTVQPVLDRYCISCHGTDKNEANLNLTGVQNSTQRNASHAYYGLVMQKPDHWVAVAYRNKEKAFSVPKQYYAHAGKLANYLLTEHKKYFDFAQDRNAWERLVTWLDLNAQYQGDYESGIDTLQSDETGKKTLLEKITATFGPEIAQRPWETLVNPASPQDSWILNAPLAKSAGGWGLINKWNSKDDPEYKEMVQLVEKSFSIRTRFYVDGWNSSTAYDSFVRRAIDQRRGSVPATLPDWPQFNGKADGFTEISGAAAEGKPGWKVVRVSSEEKLDGDNSAAWAIDGIDDGRAWRTNWTDYPRKTPPHELVFDIGESQEIAGIRYSNGDDFGRIRFCQIFVSDNPADFAAGADCSAKLAAQGQFPGRDRWQNAIFDKPVKGRYVMIRSVADYQNSEIAAAREIRLYVSEQKE